MEINLDEDVVKALDEMETSVAIRAILEFNIKALLIGQKVSNLLQKELRDRDKSKLAEDLSWVQAKYEEEKAAWVRGRQL
ncbi:hypothetical protein DEO72_LG4g390 [Vigna unguiculata]|uniref:Uncharacterized protein n=1 Tax=Vigna unguiculata TaxID=3917 RepID=A0A4D6LMH2_VIGUN|nr:hypothetical protein DEO72_LG4g390 [Vigna unguiculata]